MRASSAWNRDILSSPSFRLRGNAPPRDRCKPPRAPALRTNVRTELDDQVLYPPSGRASRCRLQPRDQRTHLRPPVGCRKRGARVLARRPLSERRSGRLSTGRGPHALRGGGGSRGLRPERRRDAVLAAGRPDARTVWDCSSALDLWVRHRAVGPENDPPRPLRRYALTTGKPSEQTIGSLHRAVGRGPRPPPAHILGAL